MKIKFLTALLLMNACLGFTLPSYAVNLHSVRTQKDALIQVGYIADELASMGEYLKLLDKKPASPEVFSSIIEGTVMQLNTIAESLEGMINVGVGCQEARVDAHHTSKYNPVKRSYADMR